MKRRKNLEAEVVGCIVSATRDTKKEILAFKDANKIVGVKGMVTTVLPRVIGGALLALLTVSAHSQCTVQLIAGSDGNGNDTFITEHPNLGGPNSNHGTDWRMWVIGSQTFQSFPMIFFDLGTVGPDCQTVLSDGTLTLNVVDTWGQNKVSQVIEVLLVLVPWVEDDVTWNSFGPGVIIGQNVDSPPLDVETKTVGPCKYTTTVPPPGLVSPITCASGSVTFTVPMATVQSWIDSPETNYGILLYSNSIPTHKDIVFASRENQYSYPDSQPVPGPKLTYIGGPAK